MSGLCLDSESVIDITHSMHDAKSKPLPVFHFCKSTIQDDPRPCAHCIILSSCHTCRPKTLSGLHSGKTHDKNATASGPHRGMIPLCLLNQVTTAFVSSSRILPLIDDFVRFSSSPSRSSQSKLNGKGI